MPRGRPPIDPEIRRIQVGMSISRSLIDQLDEIVREKKNETTDDVTRSSITEYALKEYIEKVKGTNRKSVEARISQLERQAELVSSQLNVEHVTLDAIIREEEETARKSQEIELESESKARATAEAEEADLQIAITEATKYHEMVTADPAYQNRIYEMMKTAWEAGKYVDITEESNKIAREYHEKQILIIPDDIKEDMLKVTDQWQEQFLSIIREHENVPDIGRAHRRVDGNCVVVYDDNGNKYRCS